MTGPPEGRSEGISSQEKERLRLRALGYGCELQAVQLQQFQDYLNLLYRWNRVYNLTAVPACRAVSSHLLDSLSIMPFIQGARLLDVGSGAGLPGIPLAIADETLKVSLCESSDKRCRFLHQVVTELGLTRVEVVSGRVENIRDDRGYTCIVSRGYARLGEFVASTRHLLAPGGSWLAMKGRVDEAELGGLAENICVENRLRLEVDGIDGFRQLVLMRETGKS